MSNRHLANVEDSLSSSLIEALVEVQDFY
jgi:hypothetical protein